MLPTTRSAIPSPLRSWKATPLMADGRVASTPRTQLVDEITRDLYKPPATD